MCFFHPESPRVCVCVYAHAGLKGSAVVVDDLMVGILFCPEFPQGSQLGQLYV